MKIIDLLNKIANGQEVPKKIEYRNIKFVYDETNKIYTVENYNEYNDLLMELSNYKGTDLNYEVEILEEEKKIPEKIEYYDDSIAWVIDDVGQLSDVDKVIIDKLNDLIDYLKSKGE